VIETGPSEFPDQIAAEKRLREEVQELLKQAEVADEAKAEDQGGSGRLRETKIYG